MAENTSRVGRYNWLWFGCCVLSVGAAVALYVRERHAQYTAPSASDGASNEGANEGASNEGASSDGASNDRGKPNFEQLRALPHLFFRSAKRGEYGQVSIAALQRSGSEYASSPLTCERFAFAGERGICVIDNRINLTPPAKAQIVDRNFGVLHSVDLAGIPSRARVSADGRYAVATVFTAGDDYESEFSTRTTLIDTHSGALIADLEQFTVLREGRVISEVDFNFWGVSFKHDSNGFFATLASKGKTYLVEGDIRARRVVVLRENVECPSLSPDQTRLVFKSKNAGSPGWRLHALDLRTQREWTLQSEERSVDDQVEWLDDEHVLYRILEDRGLPEQALNIWSIPVAPEAKQAPTLFVRGASSPSVQRDK